VGGQLYCWGNNDHGQLNLPNANYTSPTLVPVGARIAALAAMGSRTCVLTEANAVICYGI
jgi:alpha-tubulin suppressor-like RCC1 family protein